MSWRDAALNHAKAVAPNESCGLVVNYEGVEVYWKCRNIADESDCFAIHPADWAEAEDTGVIIAVIHSHANNLPEPSDMDRQICERSQLTWHIVNPADASSNYCEPSKLVKAVR